MPISRTLRAALLFTCAMRGSVLPAAAQDAPAVRAVLFYSPSCAHCAIVIQETLPPLIDTYGSQLQIIAVNTATEGGSQLFLAAIDYLSIPEDRRAVPTLIVGTTALLGSLEIPELLPGLIEEGLAQGGVDWPAIPGLAEAIAAIPTPIPATPSPGAATTTQEMPPTQAAPTSGPSAAIVPSLPTDNPSQMSVADRIMLDPAGNTLAIVVLIGMILALVTVGLRLYLKPDQEQPAWQTWAIPLLSIAGAVIAGYLTYIETSGNLAVCGPVGDCNTVQQSEYAKLFGLIPVGLLGLVGYILILAAWVVGRVRSDRLAEYAALSILALTAFGTLFSTGLTYLEPFVIGATCMWCVTSAAIMTILLWLATNPAIAALTRLEADQETHAPAAGH